MKVVWATDVHLDFLSRPQIRAWASTLEGDVLILTGDISNGKQIVEHLKLLDESFSGKLLFVLGNHDFYGASIEPVREEVRSIASDTLVYMHGNTVKLGETYFIGVDGFSDGLAGKPCASFQIRDRQQILDLRYHPNQMEVRRELGKADAELLKSRLEALPEDAKDIVVLTHIPPFPQAAWYQGKMSEERALPWFCCVQVGLVLGGFAFDNPDKKIRTFCGHTHGGGVYHHSENLTVYTGASEYGTPKLCGSIELI